MERYTDKLNFNKIDRQTDRKTQKDRPTDVRTETHKKTDWQTYGQADRMTDR